MHFELLSNQNAVLQKMVATCDRVAENCYQSLRTHSELAKITDALKVNSCVTLMERDLQQEYYEQKQECEAAKSVIQKDIFKDLEKVYQLLGYRLTDSRDFGNEGAKQVTLHYNEYCCLKLSVGRSYDLLHIQPEHPNFAQIQQFLRDTQDMPGLLVNVQKYYALILKLKEEIA